ncbi:MAG: toprim domain-containing protein [Nitrososphaeraceae archaeon]
MLKDVYDASKPGKLTSFGKGQLACGSGVFTTDWIILVEGRADVINLLRAGFDNSIAIEGAKIDESITNLTEGKKVIAFLDGDRAGDLILKELRGLVSIDKVYRAPQGREVEECTPLEISEILSNVMENIDNSIANKKTQSSSNNYQKYQRTNNTNQYHSNLSSRDSQFISNKNEDYVSKNDQNTNYYLSKDDVVTFDEKTISTLRTLHSEINETLEAILLDDSMNTILKVPVSELIKKLPDISGGKILILDGIITQRLIDSSNKSGIEQIIGHRLGDIKQHYSIKINTFNNIGLN